MNQNHEVMKSLAEIDRLRDEIRAMEEQIGQLGDRVDKCGGNDEAFRQIGEWDRHATDLRQPLTKQIAALRTSAPEAFQAWVERNSDTLNRQIMAVLAKSRPEVKTLEDGLLRITLDAKFSNDDLAVLRLAGFLDEWRDLAAGKRPFVLNPPSWETYPTLPCVRLELADPLSLDAELSGRHADIISILALANWHTGLLFLAELLSILDFGKPCRIEQAISASDGVSPWESFWTLTTGQLTLSLKWGEERLQRQPSDAGTPVDSGLTPFRRFAVSGLMPNEKIQWDGSLGDTASPFAIEFHGLREDRAAAIEALARRLYKSVTRTSPAGT